MADNDNTSKRARVTLGPRVRDEISQEIDRFVYELKSSPDNLPRREQDCLNRIAELARLLASTLVTIALTLALIAAQVRPASACEGVHPGAIQEASAYC